MSDEEIKETAEQVNEKEDISSSINSETTNPENVDEAVTETKEKPVKRRRGRPRKNQSSDSKVEETKVEDSKVEDSKVEETKIEDSKATTKPRRRKAKSIDQEEIKSTDQEEIKSTEPRRRKVKEVKSEETSDILTSTETINQIEPEKVDISSTKENIEKTYKSISKAENNINLTGTGVNGTLLVYKTPSNKSIKRAITGRFEYASDYDDVFIKVEYVKPSIGLIFGYVRRSEYIVLM